MPAAEILRTVFLGAGLFLAISVCGGVIASIVYLLRGPKVPEETDRHVHFMERQPGVTQFPLRMRHRVPPAVVDHRRKATALLRARRF